MNDNLTKTQRLVQGHGINDLVESVYINGKALKFYQAWVNMLRRCYSKKYQAKYPTYIGCSVCPRWFSLSNFREWYNIHYREGMELDKDILIPGNKIYNPEACSFVPRYINSLLCDSGATRGELPLGVTARKSKLKNGKITTTYLARCWDGHGKPLTGTFKTIPEAAAWYSAKKKEVVKEIVLDAFWRNEIMSDVATALLEREW